MPVKINPLLPVERLRKMFEYDSATCVSLEDLYHGDFAASNSRAA